MINKAFNKLLSGIDLDDTITLEVFDKFFSNKYDPIVFSSFVTALKFKKESSSEYFCAVTSARKYINKINLNCNNEDLIENICFFEPKNLIDISFGVDIICSSNSLGVLKYSFQNNKSFNTLIALGVEIDNEKFIKEFNSSCFGYFNLDKNEKYIINSSKIRENIPFDNIINFIDRMLNPYNAKNQMLGICDMKSVEKFADICLKLNNSNSIVVSGENKIPFCTVEGTTKIAEAWKNKIFTYNLTPELLGFKTYSIDKIECESVEEGAEILLNIFKGKIKNAPYAAVIMNAGLALYISKKAPSIIDGVELAKKTIDSSLAYEKFLQIKNIIKTNV